MGRTTHIRDQSTDVDHFDRDIQLTRALAVLKKENGELRQLVVRLSETILKNVISGPSLLPAMPTAEPAKRPFDLASSDRS